MPLRTVRHVIAIFATVIAFLAFGGVAQAAPVAAPAPPASDPFYNVPADLAKHKPGTVLKWRPITFVRQGNTVPVAASQVFYRSTGELGQPIGGVTTILRPLVPVFPDRIVSFHMEYDALGSQCDPSYTLRGGPDGKAGQLETDIILSYLASGHTVVVPDYEGLKEEWTIGHQSGQLALDGIRAAENSLRLPRSTKVAMVGYSGGSVPTGFGSAIAPKYAPDLNLIGSAAGGVLVTPAHNLNYVNGSNDWSGVIPALVVSYSRAYGFDTSFLSPKGQSIVNTVSTQCIASFASKYPGLTDTSMLNPPTTSLTQIPELAAAMARNDMTKAGRPEIPTFLAVGQIKGQIGDGVMITNDVRGLGQQWNSSFLRYGGLSHYAAFIPFERDAAIFLQQQFAR